MCKSLVDYLRHGNFIPDITDEKIGPIKDTNSVSIHLALICLVFELRNSNLEQKPMNTGMINSCRDRFTIERRTVKSNVYSG